jgi:glycosyltransferase involved in cell wall biosynthesis
MKLILLIPCLLGGGTEIQTLSISQSIQSLGHDVNVLCYFEYENSLVKAFKEKGTVIKLLDLKRRKPFLYIISKIREELRLLKPDIVHVQYMAPGALPIIAARLAGVKKVFATVHQPYTKSHGIVSKLILRLASLLTTKFIAVSQNAEMSWFGSSRLFDESKPLSLQSHHFTIHNAIDSWEIQKITNDINKADLKKELNISHRDIIIGAVSRLRQEKGIDTLIKAFSLLTQNYTNIHLLIVGTGPDEEVLKSYVKESGISSQVVFYGQASWERAMELLSIMDIVVVPSRFEGFGLTAAEAMAAGKPVIASNTSGLKEVVCDNQTGLLFPVGDFEALKNSMVKLASDSGLRENLGLAGKERVKKYFSIESFRKKIYALYNITD